MTVRVVDGIIFLEGAPAVEDAEPLLLALQAAPDAVVDIAGASRLHMAIVQLLLATRPAIRGVPTDPFLRDRLLPLLQVEMIDLS